MITDIIYTSRVNYYIVELNPTIRYCIIRKDKHSILSQMLTMDTNQSQRMVLHVHVNLVRGIFKVIVIDYGNIGNLP